MSQHKRFRRVTAGMATALVAFTGVGAGAAFAEEPAAPSQIERVAGQEIPAAVLNAERLEGKFVIAGEGRSYYVYPAPQGMTFVQTLDDQRYYDDALVNSSAQFGFYTFPGLGRAGEVRSADGRCLTQTEPMVMMSCNGDVKQQFRLRENAQLVAVDTGYGLHGVRRTQWDGEPPLHATNRVMGASTLRLSLLQPSKPDYPEFSAQLKSVDAPNRSAVISGTGKPGGEVTLNGGSSVRIAADGTWSGSVAQLAFGDNSVRVDYFEDGVRTSSASVTVRLEIAPLSARAEFSNDLSSFASISGTAHPGATVEITRGNALVASGISDAATGAYRFDVAPPHAGGVQSYAARQIVDGKDAGSASVQIDFGAAVTIATPVSGQVHGGGPLRFQGHGVAGGLVSLTQRGVTGVQGSATVASNGVWTIELNSVAHKNALFVVEQRGRGANTTTASVEINVGVTGEELDVLTPVQGSNVAPGVVKFAGTANAGSTVELRSNLTGNLLGSATTDASGRWSADVNRPLTAGNYTILVQNGGLQVARSFVVTAPVVQEKLEVTAPVQGERLRPGTVTFVGTANAGARIELRSNVSGALLGSTTANSLGNWVTDVNRPLGAGDYRIVVKNGTLEVQRSFIVGDTPVAAPLTVTSPAQQATVAPGIVTFRGAAAPGAAIEIRSITTHALLGHGTANGSGAWVIDINRPLGADTYAFRVQSGTQSVERQFKVATTPSVNEQLAVATPAAGGTVKTGKVTFTGTANAGAKVELRSNVSGVLLGEGTANQAGNWSAETQRALTPGMYTVVVKNGSKTVERTFRVADIPVVGQLDVVAPAQGATVNPGPVAFTGTADPAAKVVLRSNVSGLSLGETTADGAGKWSVRTDIQLGVGSYTILVQSEGNEVARSFQIR
ncbi:hypothetical protein FB468_1422 [Leucobacter komagatae]|uniref:Bacterial Ig domain-containing protein n=1 Tax=Leucobacter komagatae TaxID=55969 RepID=A0A542Y5Q0_9MICO|nr:hypothetical protein [Leucobacter komagatae]TQL43401.1 hypothetical protein FB468_1422 [Leucobacter komagatae]